MRAPSNKPKRVEPRLQRQAAAVTASTGRINRAKPSRTEPDRTGPDLVGLTKVRKRRKKRSTLTLSQPVLEVGVTPSFPVEIDAVTDEQSPAHPRG